MVMALSMLMPLSDVGWRSGLGTLDHLSFGWKFLCNLLYSAER
jgi:hypothetical protein